MKILLDTCTFLWILADAPDLSPTARSNFLDPQNDVYLSSVSAWEILVKWKLGKLPLPESPDKFITLNRRAHGIQTLALHERAVVRLRELADVHRDPFDRMLVCQALVGGMTILTPDAVFRSYSAPVLW